MSGTTHVRLPEFILEQLDVGIVVLDRTRNIVLWNHFMAVHSGRSAADVVGRNLFECFPDLPRKWLEKKLENVLLLETSAFTSWHHRPYVFEFPDYRAISGRFGHMRQSCTFLPTRGDGDVAEYICLTIQDCTEAALFQLELDEAVTELEKERAEQRKLIARLEDAHNQLLQSEKLASIGQLAAGVAHEINNPIGFVNSNMGALDKYLIDLLQLVQAYEKAEGAMSPAAPELAAVKALKEQIDLQYLKEDVVSLVKESKDGLERVKKIVQDLKDFSRLGNAELVQSDLHKCLDSTLNVVANEIRYKAEVVKEYGSIPEVECVPSQLNQVFMNLVVNAAQAIPERGQIKIATGTRDEWVWVAISDTGAGIAAENLSRIFDPFFTTKPVGSGTGLGLSVSHTIVAKHHGRIEVQSQVGTGTTFQVWLPIAQADAQSASAARVPEGVQQ